MNSAVYGKRLLMIDNIKNSRGLPRGLRGFIIEDGIRVSPVRVMALWLTGGSCKDGTVGMEDKAEF